MSRPAAIVIGLALGACASEPEDRIDTVFDQSAGYVEVVVLGDGFVRAGERRIPLELFVLEQRRRTRAMTGDELSRYVVHVRLAPIAGDAAAVKAQQDVDRLLQQLDVMEVGQVRLL